MSRYDGLIIPRSYSEYINKTDAATLSQALALPGVMDAAPTENSNKAARSGGIYSAIDAVKPVDTVTLNNMQSVTSNAVSRAMSYSTNEVNTGKKWINGKDIYRKVLVVNFTDSTAISIPVSNEISVNDYQVMDLAHSYIYNPDYGTRQPWASNATTQNNIYVSNGNLSFETSHPSGTLYAVIEYTKTV